MKTYWQYDFPGNIYFGENAVEELQYIYSNLGNNKNTLLITDQGIVKSGILDKVESKLQELSIPYKIFDEAKPEPTVNDVNQVAESFINEEIDILIGLGGGSCIDLAKMVALLLESKGSIRDYYDSANINFQPKTIIAIPTTAGTGSEVTGVAVVNDEERNLKVGLSSSYLKPAYAILDPYLTVGMPPRVTACSGIDALVHCVEAYTSKNYDVFDTDYRADFRGSTPLSNLFAREAIRLISSSLVDAYQDGKNIEARSNMLLGSLIAGLAFSNAGTSLSHAMAYAIGGRVHAPHGEATGLMLPYVAKYNFKDNPEKFLDILSICNVSQVEGDLEENETALFNYFITLLEDIGLPTKLSAINVKEEDLEDMAKETMNITRLMNLNPRMSTAETLFEVFKAAY